MPRARPLPLVESDPLRILAAIRPFFGLGAIELSQLSRGANLLRIAKGAPIWHFGTPPRQIFVLVQGLLKRSGAGSNGSEQVLELVLPGELTGLAEAIANQPHETEAIAASASWVLALDAGEVLAAAAASGVLSWRLTQLLAEQRLAVERDVSSRHTQNASERLLGFLVRLAPQPFPDCGETLLNLPASKHLIASRLGMTPETLSRALRDLSDAGLLIQRDNRLALCNAAISLYRHSQVRHPVPAEDRERGRDLPLHALVNIAGRQRMLSQRMARLWLMKQMELAPAHARRQLIHSIELFSTQQELIESLMSRQGLNIPVAAVTTAWKRFRHQIESATRLQADEVLSGSEELLTAMDMQAECCASLCRSKFAPLINRAGRQRMLVQRVAKLALFSSARIRTAECVRDCVRTQRDFVEGLRTITAQNKSKQLQKLLNDVATEWDQLQSVLPETANRVIEDRAVLIDISERADHLVRRINEIVQACQRQAEMH